MLCFEQRGGELCRRVPENIPLLLELRIPIFWIVGISRLLDHRIQNFHLKNKEAQQFPMWHEFAKKHTVGDVIPVNFRLVSATTEDSVVQV